MGFQASKTAEAISAPHHHGEVIPDSGSSNFRLTRVHTRLASKITSYRNERARLRKRTSERSEQTSLKTFFFSVVTSIAFFSVCLPCSLVQNLQLAYGEDFCIKIHEDCTMDLPIETSCALCVVRFATRSLASLTHSLACSGSSRLSLPICPQPL